MKRSLKAKLIISYLAVALITVLVVSALIRLTSGQSLMSLVVEQQTAAMAESLQNYYTENGSLQGFFEYYAQTGRSKPAPQHTTPNDRPPDMRDIRGLYGMVDTNYQAIIPTLNYKVGETVPREMINDPVAVEVDGETIAWILPDTKLQFKLSPEEEFFLRRTNTAILLAAIAGVLVAVAMGVLLAGELLKPIRQLTRASQVLAQGELEQQIPVSSQDELGQLTRTFNQMSADLAQADQQRKRLTADITHDLSTPLQVISGYMEMFEAGDVQLTPQRIEIIKTEVDHLRRLVGDLSTLTQVEAGGLDIQAQPVSPAVLLKRVCNAFQPIAARQNVNLFVDIPVDVPPIMVDEGRMLQVLKNLVENALRYTPAGGSIRLSAEMRGKVELRVSDNGTGIEAEDLPYVFERFYRADKARGMNAGKMGLGLAICKALVDMQGGMISAESAGKDQGTTILLKFDPAVPIQHG
jgi:signal transduction histidine kinase